MYVDDTVLVCSDRNMQYTCEMSENTLRKVREWCDKNKIVNYLYFKCVCLRAVIPLLLMIFLGAA